MKHRRVKEIENFLMERESALLEELCDRFAVSKVTIRRDLAELEQLGIVKKIYGGVVLSSKAENLVPYYARQESRAEEKRRIGRRAAAMVAPGDIVLIDAGSTTTSMVRFLNPDYRVTVITNSLSVMNEAAAMRNVRLISVGGEYLRETNSMVGMEAIETVGRINARAAFLGATGLSATRGITNSSSIEAEIKRAIIAASARRVLLVDSSKFDVISLTTFAELAQIDAIVSDEDPPPTLRDALRGAGVEFHRAQ